MKKIQGEISLPGDKSISHRSALFSAIRPGGSHFSNFNFNRDCSATLDCLKALGIEWQAHNNQLNIQGKSTRDWSPPLRPLHAQNSGTTARLLSGILAGLSAPSMLIGDHSLSRRPMKRVLDPLTRMGANIESKEDYLPLKFHPVDQLRAIHYTLPMASAQVKSAILLAGLYAAGETEVIEPEITRDHTERLLGLKTVVNDDGSRSIFSSPDVHIPELSMEIPGDFSSAAFFIVAAMLLPGSELMIKGVSLNPTRTALLQVLYEMGARIEISVTREKPEPGGNIFVRYSPLKNIEINPEIVPNIIDEIPILAILASQSEGKFLLQGARELRYKESDRLKAISENLNTVGIRVTELPDGLEIDGPQKFTAGKVTTYGDHRIAMSFAIASLLTDDTIDADDPDCAAVSFPQFWDILRSITR
jgi:3-phosphoshikimate 1-carboxyvinyltransferase